MAVVYGHSRDSLAQPTHADTGGRADALEAECRKIRSELERHRCLLEDSDKKRRDFEDSSRQVPRSWGRGVCRTRATVRRSTEAVAFIQTSSARQAALQYLPGSQLALAPV
jgi:hypothetical protein